MTPEFGAASQLEKIDMLDFADVVAVNKFERRGGADAVRDVSRQLIRNREAFGAGPADMPVFGTSAATFNDTGVTALYQHLARLLRGQGPAARPGGAARGHRQDLDRRRVRHPAGAQRLPGGDRRFRSRTTTVRPLSQVAAVRREQQLAAVRDELSGDAEREVAVPA